MDADLGTLATAMHVKADDRRPVGDDRRPVEGSPQLAP